MQLNLIPFGLNKATGELVDVAEVARGKGCGCICPSCKTPLMAKKGEIKEWHFAHASRAIYKSTEQACEFSFYVSVRMMARQMIGNHLGFKVPELTVTKQISNLYPHEYVSMKVADERQITLKNCEVEKRFYGHEIDVFGIVGNVPFGIFFTHPFRDLPHHIKIPEGELCGLVSVSLTELQGSFAKARAEGTSYKNIIKNLLENDTSSKSWLYHPKYKKISELVDIKVKERLQEKTDETPIRSEMWSLDSEKNSFTIEPVELKLTEYQCVMCKVEWKRLNSPGNVCPECGSYLYIRELV